MEKLSIEEKAKACDKVSKEVKDFFEGKRKKILLFASFFTLYLCSDKVVSILNLKQTLI